MILIFGFKGLVILNTNNPRLAAKTVYLQFDNFILVTPFSVIGFGLKISVK